VDVTYTLVRAADVAGTIESPTLGTFDFTGRSGRFGITHGETLLPFEEWDG
jgi:hypothetical protein